MDAETKLKKAHIRLMNHPETALYSGVILMGKVEVKDDVPTACTNGKDVYYGRGFVDSLPLPELCGVVLHETLHKMLRQITRHLDLAKEDGYRLNMAMDYVVNDVVDSIKDKNLAVLPEGALLDPKYKGWSVRDVYRDLPPQDKDGGKGKGEGNGKGGGQGAVIDDHNFDDAQELSADELKAMDEEIDEAVRQGAILAGKMNAKIPRAVKDIMEPKVNWRDVLRDFVTSNTSGKSEYSWRKFNKRRLGDDIYLPSTVDESVDHIIVAIDTSGSINQHILNDFVSELSGICSTVEPASLTVLWWGSKVVGSQTISGNYQNLAAALRPVGGGGTCISSVSEYITKNRLNADCLVVLTDGYVESDVTWSVNIPSLWVVTQNRSLRVPSNVFNVKYDK